MVKNSKNCDGLPEKHEGISKYFLKQIMKHYY